MPSSRPAKARELYFLSDRVGAEEAERLGLANRVVAPDSLLAEALAIAEKAPRVDHADIMQDCDGLDRVVRQTLGA